MIEQLEVARGLKDKDYFRSLQPAEQEAIVAAGGIGPASITDEFLESVSSGLEGGTPMAFTTSAVEEEEETAQRSGALMVTCTC
ncbi:hypothetical protein [Nocardia wallacei]|uniref:hypothetical protein n=1 Tax=Nocardia wallacei TaxID=480035 RepID=UPI002454D7B6|nr:hypothetical protein [Nocardia wallacei]